MDARSPAFSVRPAGRAMRHSGSPWASVSMSRTQSQPSSVTAPSRWAKLAQRDGAVTELGWDCVRDIDTDAHGEPLWRIALPAGLTENAGDLASIEEYVVRPLQGDRKSVV